MSDSFTYQRTLRLHLGHEQAAWLRHETVMRFEDGRETVVDMDFEKVSTDVAMQYPAARRSCEEQAEYSAQYQRERKQGLNRERRPRPKRTPRPRPAPRWLTELAPQPEDSPQPEPQPEVEPEAPQRGKAQIRPFDWAQFNEKRDRAL